MKKMLGGALFSVFVVALLVGFRDNLVRCWAAPEAIKVVEKKIETQEELDKKQQETLETLKDLYKEQHMESEAQKKIDAAQLEALKAIVDSQQRRGR